MIHFHMSWHSLCATGCETYLHRIVTKALINAEYILNACVHSPHSCAFGFLYIQCIHNYIYIYILYLPMYVPYLCLMSGKSFRIEEHFKNAAW